MPRRHASHLDASVSPCRYEEYLDGQITGTDMYYLEDLELARQLVELGCAAAPAMLASETAGGLDAWLNAPCMLNSSA